MTELKREYVIPLRRKTRFAPKWRRSKKAVSVLKNFIKKHMKTENVIICPELNERIWENGIKNPPGKISVIALKTKILETEKTYVNLSSIGVEKYIEKTKTELPKTENNKNTQKEEKTIQESKNKQEVINTESKEKNKEDTKNNKEEDKK